LTYLLALFLTLLFEVPVALLLLRGQRTGVWSAAFSSSLISHPLLWFVMLPFMSVFMGEILVFVLETGVYFTLVKPITLQRAAATSALANLFSWGVGGWCYQNLLGL
jgi:hypothetical protein